MDLQTHIEHYLSLGLTIIPLKPRSKKPLVRWGSGWNPSIDQLQSFFAQSANVGLQEVGSSALSGVAGSLTTDFDFNNAAPFEFTLATTTNSKRSGHD